MIAHKLAGLLSPRPLDQTETGRAKVTALLTCKKEFVALDATLIGAEGMRVTLPSGRQIYLPYIRCDQVECLKTADDEFYLQNLALTDA